MQKRETYLPYGFHWIDESDSKAVGQVLERGLVSQGPKIREFEEKLAKYVGTKHAIAVNNGTSALELALKANGVGKGDSVITSPLSFVASANSALFNQAKVEFADIDKETFNIDAKQIEAKVSEKTKAIVPMHFAGQCCQMDEIKEVAERHNLAVVEDAAHALGAELNEKKAGSFGESGCFSFHPVKHITMGEGGAITTDDSKLYESLLLLRDHGIDRNAATEIGNAKYGYDVKELSRNYRVSDIGCALALSQFERLEAFLQRRAEIAESYSKAFKGIEGITVPKLGPNRRHAWHIYCVLVEKRDRLFKFLRKQNIGVNVHYKPIYRMSLYKGLYGLDPLQFPNTEHVFEKTLTLPLFPKMSDQDVEYVIEKVVEGAEKVGK